MVCNTYCRFTLRAASVLLLCWSTNLPLAVSEAKHLPFVLQLALQFRLITLNTHFRIALNAPAGVGAATAAAAAAMAA